jgi:hypothetical protein
MAEPAMPTLTPPDDWDCEVLLVRLYVGHDIGLDSVKRLLYENEVKLEWHEGGAWSAIGVWPAWSLPCGTGVRIDGTPETPTDGLGGHAGRFDPPQRVRAGRTRLWFPEPAWGFIDVRAKGMPDWVFPCYTEIPGTVITECFNAPSEVQEG